MIVTNNNSTTSALASGVNDIRELKPPIAITSVWDWLGWVLALLAVLAVAIWFWRRLHKRMTYIAPAPVIPAHVRARQKLREALPLITQPKPFCVAVSDAERAYLEERFTFRAPERTTEEFLRELSATDLLTKPQKESLGKFLESCDLVKFAKYEPGETELRELYGAAMRLVDETADAENPESRIQNPEAE
ncbi:MAG: hypothetical protein RLZZ350_1536 [Verrucomicrobiota bacterium]|jgi:hypothetical protein